HGSVGYYGRVHCVSAHYCVHVLCAKEGEPCLSANGACPLLWCSAYCWSGVTTRRKWGRTISLAPILRCLNRKTFFRHPCKCRKVSAGLPTSAPPWPVACGLKKSPVICFIPGSFIHYPMAISWS